MTQPQDLGHDDRLVRYLLGLLPAKDAERLDELTVADDEMAWRLRVAENDLVDAYVSGTLTGQRRERFESFYLSSEHRRRKVRFARSFLASVERDAEATDIERVRDSIRAEDSPLPRSRVLSPRADWGLAAAAALFLLAGGTLYDDVRLHRALDEARRVSDALSNRAHDLERQLNDHRVADASLARELENVPATRTTEVTSRELPVVALVLLPQTRALGPVTTLAGQTRERFESFYLSSEHRRRKVRFARSFLASVERDAEATDIESVRDSIRAEDSPLPRSRVLSSRASWGLAAAAALFLLAGGTLYDDARLHRALDEARRVSDALSNRAHDLERQLNDHRVADASLVRELENSPATRTTEVTSREVPVVALVLLPQTRALGPVTTLAVPQGVDRIALELSLEPNDYRDYQVALRDQGTSRIVWRSNRITARTAGDVPTVSVIVPASVLKAQHYSLELDGLSAGGAEVVGTYVFRMVQR